MKGLLIKELYSMSVYTKNLLLMLAIFIAFGVFLGQSHLFVPAMLFMAMMLFVMSQSQMEDKTGWDKYAACLPVARRTVVGARYVYLLVMMLGAAVVAYASGVLMALYQQAGPGWPVHLAGVCGAMMLLYLLVAALTQPIIYKLGGEKARLALMVLFVGPYVGAMVLGPRLAPMMLQLAGLPMALLISGAVVLVAGLYTVSFFLSAGIYQKKEF